MTAPYSALPPIGYFHRHLQLTPKQFGYMGSYSRDLLRVQEMPEAFGQMAVQFTTSVLSGKTVTDRQRATVKVPSSWWQHLKETAGKRHREWMRQPSSPWLLFLLPLDVLTLVPRVYLVPWFLRRYPVKYAELTAEVRFTRDVLYPGADVSLPPDRFGMPVLWEAVEIAPLADAGPAWQLDDYGEARFLGRHDLVREIFGDRDREIAGHGIYGSSMMTPADVLGILEWLGRHGVNADQLVPRDAATL